MTIRTGTALALVVAAVLCATTLAVAAPGPGRGGGAAPPRARSVTLGDVTAFEVKDNVSTIERGPGPGARHLLPRRHLPHLAGAGRHFTEAQPTPTTRRWSCFKGAPIAVASRDAGEYYRIESHAACCASTRGRCASRCSTRRTSTVIWQETQPLTYGPSTVQTLRRGEAEHFYGGGMQNGYFSHRDTSVNIRLNTRGWGDGTTPNPAPFYMSTAGYGVFRNTMAPGRYDFLVAAGALARRAAIRRLLLLRAVAEEDPRRLHARHGPAVLPAALGPRVRRRRLLQQDRQDDRRHRQGRRVYRANDMPGGWILPNDGYGCGYQDLPQTIQELHKRGFYTGLWTEKGLDRIANEVQRLGSRVMKLDVAWVGRGYQFALQRHARRLRGHREEHRRARLRLDDVRVGGRPALLDHLVGRPVGQLGVHPLPHPDGDRRGALGLQRRHRRRGRHLRRRRADAGARPAVEGAHAGLDDHQRLVEADQPDEAAVDLRRAVHDDQPQVHEAEDAADAVSLHLLARGLRHRRADGARDGARVPGRPGDVVEADAVPVHERRVVARRAGLRGLAGPQRHLPAGRQVDRLLGRHASSTGRRRSTATPRRSTSCRCS